MEDAVWQAITEALQHPELLAKEYQQRIAQAAKPASIEAERKQMTAVLKRVKAQEDRVTDAYVNEAMGLDRYKAEMEKLRQKCTELERCVKELDARQQQEQDGRKALKNLDRFCHQVSEGLETMTFEERQQLLRLLVERVTVEEGRVRVETVIPTEHDNVRNRYPERVEGR